MLVFREQAVKQAQSALYVAVHDILSSGSWTRQSGLFHQFEAERDVVDALLEGVGGQMETVQWHEISLQQAIISTR